MEEEAAISRKLNLKGLKLLSRNWILGRSTNASGTSLKFDNPTTEEAVSKILKYAEDKEKSSFKPSRERDKLSLGLGNKEHTGRTRWAREKDDLEARIQRGQAHVQETWPRPGN